MGHFLIITNVKLDLKENENTKKHNYQTSLQKDLYKCNKEIKTIRVQLIENKLVKKELTILNNNTKIFKMIGPILVPQSLIESKVNVKERIEYLIRELQRLEYKHKELKKIFLKKQ